MVDGHMTHCLFMVHPLLSLVRFGIFSVREAWSSGVSSLDRLFVVSLRVWSALDWIAHIGIRVYILA